VDSGPSQIEKEANAPVWFEARTRHRGASTFASVETITPARFLVGCAKTGGRAPEIIDAGLRHSLKVSPAHFLSIGAMSSRGDPGCGMKPYTRKSFSAVAGTHEGGKGAINTPSAVAEEVPYGSGSDLKQRGTNPPELIADRARGSFSMTLANELGEAGYRRFRSTPRRRLRWRSSLPPGR